MIDKREQPHSRLTANNHLVRRTDSRMVGMPVGGFAGAPIAASASDSLLRVVWRGRWVMLLCIVSALVAGFVYVQTTTPIYTSTSKLYLDYGGVRISPSYESGSIPRTDKYLHTQAGLLRSRPILAAAVDLMKGQRMRTFSDVDVPVAYLHRNIVIDVGKKDEIISVSFDSAYPIEAAQIVNHVVDAYMTSRTEHGQRSAEQALNMLEGQLSLASKEFEEKRNALEAFQANGMRLALGSDQGNGVIQRYLELQGARTRAQIKTQEAASFLEGARALAKDSAALRQYVRVRSDISASIGTGGEKTSLEAALTALDLQIAELVEELTPDHPKVSALAAKRERIQARLAALDDRFVEAVLAAAEQQYVAAKDAEERYSRLYDEQCEQVVMFNAEVFQYQRLRSEVDHLTTYSQTLDEQVRELRKIVGEDVGQLKMWVLETALPGEEPSEPQKNKVMAMALILGLLLGGGIAVGRDWMDQTLRSVEEISAILGLPVLGVVPAMSRRQKIQVRGQSVSLRPDSPEAEAFRTVRTAVFFGAQKEKARTMLVTSPAASDGKSTLVSNLAIAIARAGQRTLVLDADFRKPMQHAMFGVDHHERCLSGVFAGRIKLAEAIQPTKVKGLSLLTCGYSVPNPAELLNSHQFARLLEHLADAYDRVLIDAPPVTVVTDAQILGALCDFTILVLKADKSTRKIAQRAIDALQSVGAHLLGVVVNDVRRSGGRYGYYGGYRGSHGSGSDGGTDPKIRKAKVDTNGRRPVGRLVAKEDG
jgi:succinoglycan biosynthesis transport protein ExoP